MKGRGKKKKKKKSLRDDDPDPGVNRFILSSRNISPLRNSQAKGLSI